MANATIERRDEHITEARLGAYQIARRSKVFPRPFWAVMTLNHNVLVEMADGLGGFTVSWVTVSALGEAARKGDIVFEAEL